jgi:NAD-dependent SIR2 family protein deacetylase
MTHRVITAECNSCESSYDVSFVDQLVSEELPEYCPFCGEPIDSLSEDEYIEDEDELDKDEWNN